jgi:hypothetical protein
VVVGVPAVILDKIAVYALGVALAASVAFGGYAWVIHGHARYVEGQAVERAHWQDVIRKANVIIDGLNASAETVRAERDRAIGDLRDAAGKVEIVEVPVEVVKQCNLPDDARKALNAINIKKAKP